MPLTYYRHIDGLRGPKSHIFAFRFGRHKGEKRGNQGGKLGSFVGHKFPHEVNFSYSECLGPHSSRAMISILNTTSICPLIRRMAFPFLTYHSIFMWRSEGVTNNKITKSKQKKWHIISSNQKAKANFFLLFTHVDPLSIVGSRRHSTKIQTSSAQQ